MPIDPEVRNAIVSVVRELGQNELVANKLIAWLIDKSERDLGQGDNMQHLDAVRTEIALLKSE